MTTIKQEVVVDGEESGGPMATIKKDPVQEFVDDMIEEREQMIRDLHNIQQDLRDASDSLREMASKDCNYIAEMADLLKNLGKMTDVAHNIRKNDYHKGFAGVRCYINNTTFNVSKIIRNWENTMKGWNDMIMMYEHDRELLTDKNSQMLEQNAKDMEDMQISFERQIAALKNEISEKDKQLKEMQEEAEKAAKIEKLKRMNEERLMSRKELEDLEDSLSREIKTLHMRKLFIQGTHNRIKTAIPEDEKQREVIEKSLSTSMENMKSLKVEIGRI